MSNYKKKDLEAIALSLRNAHPQLQAAVVAEPLTSLLGLFYYDERGNVSSGMLWNETSWINVKASLEKQNPQPICRQENAEQIRRALSDYYMTNRALDGEALSGENAMKASELMQTYHKCGGKELDYALECAKQSLEKKTIGLNAVCFVLIGEMAEFFPAECVLRLQLNSLMPMLPNDGILLLPDPTKAISEGLAIDERFQRKFLDGSVEWIIQRLNGDGCREESLSLASDGEPVESLTQGKFSAEAVFAIPGDTVVMKNGAERQTIAVPSRVLGNGGGMLKVGVQYKNGTFQLLFKGEKQTLTQPIDLKVKGA